MFIWDLQRDMGGKRSLHSHALSGFFPLFSECLTVLLCQCLWRSCGPQGAPERCPSSAGDRGSQPTVIPGELKQAFSGHSTYKIKWLAPSHTQIPYHVVLELRCDPSFPHEGFQWVPAFRQYLPLFVVMAVGIQLALLVTSCLVQGTITSRPPVAQKPEQVLCQVQE